MMLMEDKMCKIVAYMRISTKEERGKQKFTRQEQAIVRWCKENNIEIPERRIYRDDASGKTFCRPAWEELEQDSTGTEKGVTISDYAREIYAYCT